MKIKAPFLTPATINILSIAIVACAIFVVDTQVHVDNDVPVLYVAVVLMSTRLFEGRGILIVSLGCAVLTVAGYLLSPGNLSTTISIANRLLSLSAIGATTFLALRDRSAQMALQIAQQDKSRQLELASERKSQFLASMSHELRTPLNAIIGLTEMMLSNAARFGTEKAQEPLQRVNRAGTHLLSLINQVLDLSKIEAGKLELNPQTVRRAPLINEVIGTARQLAEQNKNRLVVDAQENLRRIDRGPYAAAADSAQPAEQCLQVNEGGRGHAACAQGGGRTRMGRACSCGQRHRNDRRAAGETVSGFHPGRCRDRAALRRHWPRPCHHPQARAHDGGRRDRDERTTVRLPGG